jgi:phosphoribosylanthranilate isomerase
MIKVCGLKVPANIQEVDSLGIEYIGLNFYSRSARYVTHGHMPEELNARRVGVFVNATYEQIRHKIHHYSLDGVQLHGNEDTGLCMRLRQDGVEVWKALPVDDDLPYDRISEFAHCCDYLLFDTRTSLFGGSGERFDWTLLEAYAEKTPVWLSGGISPGDAKELRNLPSGHIVGVDINSRFETSPGLKDIGKIKSFLHELRS